MEFWDITPFEFGLKVSAYFKKTREDQEERIAIAYATAHWQRVKRMPRLKEILEEIQPKEEQTPEDMLAIVKQMHAAIVGKEG